MTRTFTGLFASLGFLAFGAASAEVRTYNGGSLPYGLASADMDKDGDLDLVTVSNSTKELRWLENDGNGDFSSPPHLTTISSAGAFPPTVGDVDLVKGPDVVIPYYGPGLCETWLNDGTGKLILQWQQGGFLSPAYATLGDINGDPSPDLVVCEMSSPQVSVYSGKGDGTFTFMSTYAQTSGVRGCVLVDLDGSGANDLVSTAYSSDRLNVWWWNSGGTWLDMYSILVGPNPFHVAAGDLNGDMNQDVAVTCANGIYVLFGDGSGGLTTQELLSTTETCYGIVIADMDGDTDLDIVSAADGKDLCIWLNKGGGTFASAVRVSVVVSVGGGDTVAVGDFNGDSIVDAAVAAYNDNAICVVLNPLGLPVTWHVRAGGSGNANGFSWANAMGHPQDAMDMAAPGDEIWVAGGWYYDDDSDDVVLTMKNGVAVYGGFAGDETSRDQRDPWANVTTLDGQDVCFHVVVGASDATLDGFTLTGGNASGSGSDSDGGGMYNDGVWNAMVTDCIFTSNTGDYGGGMYNSGGSPIVTNCIFAFNTGNSVGGGMDNISFATTSVTNCTFWSNLAGNGGGGMYNNNASPVIVNCTFADNMALNTGGGVLNSNSASATMRNCILWNNSAPLSPEIYNDVPSFTVSYSDVEGGFVGTGNIDADPIFVDDVGGDFHLGECSPCIDSADGFAAPGFDMDGNGRYDDQGMPNVGAGSPNYADMGAFEFQSDSSTITVNSPGGGETWYANETKTISWQATGTVSWVDVQLSRDGGANWEWIAGSQPSTGSYDWTVTGSASSNCVIMVSDSADGLPSAVSNAFRIANTAPSVTVTWPTDSATVSGTLTIQADATDPDDGVERVEFYIGGSLDWTDYTEPYEHVWDTTTWSDGDHEIRAVAYDYQGVTAEHKITVNVQNGSNEPPTVSITTPSDGATVSGTVYVAANAWDDSSVDRVEFYVDGSWQITAWGPYEFNWTSTTVSDGWHTIMARAYDDDGDWSDHSINVNVQNGGVTPPGPVWDFYVVGTSETTAALEWRNPGDGDFAGVIVLWRVDDWPTFTPVDGEWYHAANWHGDAYCFHNDLGEWVREYGLTLDTHYYFVAYAYDHDLNYSEAAWVDAWTTPAQAPWVDWTSPNDGETRVRPDTEIRIYFSEPMDATWTENAFSINPPVAHDRYWDDRENALVVRLTEDLQPYWWYHVTISTQARDLYGLALAWQHEFDFQAGPYASILGGGCGASGGAAGLFLVLALVLRRKRGAAT